MKISRKELERIAEKSKVESFQLWFDKANGVFVDEDEANPETAVYIYDVENEETADFIEDITNAVLMM